MNFLGSQWLLWVIRQLLSSVYVLLLWTGEEQNSFLSWWYDLHWCVWGKGIANLAPTIYVDFPWRLVLSFWWRSKRTLTSCPSSLVMTFSDDHGPCNILLTSHVDCPWIGQHLWLLTSLSSSQDTDNLVVIFWLLIDWTKKQPGSLRLSPSSWMFESLCWDMSPCWIVFMFVPPSSHEACVLWVSRMFLRLHLLLDHHHLS